MNINFSRRQAMIGASSFGTIALIGENAFAKAAMAKISVNDLSDKIAFSILADSPENCTSFAIDPKLVGGSYVGKVSDRSLNAEIARNNMVKKWIDNLSKIPTKNLSNTDKLTQKITLSSAKYSHAAAKFGFGDAGYGSPNPYIISQLTGAYVGFPDFMVSQHAIKTKEDADGYLLRMIGFAKQLKDETSRLIIDTKKGVVPPKFIIETTLKQLNASYNEKEPALINAIISKTKAAKLDSDFYGKEAKAIYSNNILPAYKALIDNFEKLKTLATDDAGVWKLPNGAEYYKAALAYWTTTNKTPDEVHELGKSLVISLGKEIDAGLKELGYKEGTIAERMSKLSEDPRFTYSNNEEGKAKLLSDINGMVKDIYAKLPDVFATLPKAGLEVKRVPPYTEAGAPGGYYQQPAPDGSRAGAYYINLRDTAAWPKWSLPTLTYHEGVPGHHHQIALAQEAKGLPFLRSKMLWFGAYGEGWALYSETVADEVGMYKNDPAGRIGYLQSMAFRAARCVVDTGIHAKKWTKQQAIDYMHQATGDTIDSITTEIERYCVWPGQATCYMVGRVKIMELREKAMKTMGDKFNIKTFHDKVLLEGAMPLDVLEEVIDNYIKTGA
ncbi:MAG: DUF885 domain-containing protein [Caulobacterales bacterium]|nr:DUF885 domain-containing protein [Caulobacterales bacterium]